MNRYTAAVEWQRAGAVFTDGRYSRGHRWRFDGGIDIPASASPHVVPHPYSVEAAVDPEEAFVAALASCHMLWFLSIAADKGWVVESYRDEAAGVVGKNGAGKMAVTQVILRPAVAFAGGNQPPLEDFEDLHRAAHEQCFIASSVTAEVSCEPADVTMQQRDPGNA